MKTTRTLATLACCLGAFRAGAQDDAAELAKKLSNPVANLISVPFQNNFDFGIGEDKDGWRYTLNIQPVIPISLGKDWNLIVRTIVPYIHQEDVFKGAAPDFEEVIDNIPVDCRGAIKAGQRAVKPGHCAVKAGLRLICGAGA